MIGAPYLDDQQVSVVLATLARAIERDVRVVDDLVESLEDTFRLELDRERKQVVELLGALLCSLEGEQQAVAILELGRRLDTERAGLGIREVCRRIDDRERAFDRQTREALEILRRVNPSLVDEHARVRRETEQRLDGYRREAEKLTPQQLRAQRAELMERLRRQQLEIAELMRRHHD